MLGADKLEPDSDNPGLPGTYGNFQTIAEAPLIGDVLYNAEREGKLSILGYGNVMNLRFGYLGITLPSPVCKVGIGALKKIP